MGEPESNRYWFPGYDSPNDFRTTEFTATVDKSLTVISNGSLVETRDNPDGTRTFHWKMDTPYANYLTSFVVGEYVDVKQISRASSSTASATRTKRKQLRPASRACPTWSNSILKSPA
jgi:aminopeptidase N